jgi:hypothetical protein
MHHSGKLANLLEVRASSLIRHSDFVIRHSRYQVYFTVYRTVTSPSFGTVTGK